MVLHIRASGRGIELLWRLRSLPALKRSSFSSDSEHPGEKEAARQNSATTGSNSGSAANAAKKGGRPRPRSPIAMAHFDYQLEVQERIREEGTMPDTEAAFEILANHRIRESMAAGEFDNLKGTVSLESLTL